jgi:sugar fermentation stimulation protein A
MMLNERAFTLSQVTQNEKLYPPTACQNKHRLMRWPDGPLVIGSFVERLHRFGATVQVNGKNEYCHVTNTGRLRELLCPGAKVGLVDHQNQPLANSKAPRKTRYSVRLAYYKKKWVCIEANIAPKLLKEAWNHGKVKSLKGYDQLQAEVPLNAHTRFDFQARNSKTGEKAWIEVKCVTLVDEKGVGHFPDAPSERASKHLRELMMLSRKPKTKCFVFFILQNPLGRGVTSKDDTDPLFGKTLRQTAKTKVSIEAFKADISLKDARLILSIPVLLP